MTISEAFLVKLKTMERASTPVDGYLEARRELLVFTARLARRVELAEARVARRGRRWPDGDDPLRSRPA